MIPVHKVVATGIEICTSASKLRALKAKWKVEISFKNLAQKLKPTNPFLGRLNMSRVSGMILSGNSSSRRSLLQRNH